MKYRETSQRAYKHRTEYLQGLERLIERRQNLYSKKRNIRDVIADQDSYRRKLCEILGWPLTEQRPKKLPIMQESLLSNEGDYSVYRLEFEVIEGLVLSGILLRHHNDQVLPLVLCQHGAVGTPEIVTGVYGDTANYNDIAKRFFAEGVNIFAPQLMIWSSDVTGPAYDRITIDSKLQILGSSITAVELYGLMRIIDYFAAQEWVGNIGMAGLSYGGFYTLYLAALDDRIKAAMTCANFCDYRHWTKSDWAWRDMESYFGEAEVACLVYPRKLYIQMGDKDELFDYHKTQNEYDRLIAGFSEQDQAWVQLEIFDGNHEFIKQNNSVVDMVSSLLK